MIELIQSGKKIEAHTPIVHAEWAAWMNASVYTHAMARAELGLAVATFYRRIAKAPTLIDKLAMRALYEGLAPFTAEDKAA